MHWLAVSLALFACGSRSGLNGPEPAASRGGSSGSGGSSSIGGKAAAAGGTRGGSSGSSGSSGGFGTGGTSSSGGAAGSGGVAGTPGGGASGSGGQAGSPALPTALALGAFHSCTSFDDGSLRCWGAGGYIGSGNLEHIGD